MAAGAIVLTISAIFATKANKKFTNSCSTGYFSKGNSATAGIKTLGLGVWLTTYNTTRPAVFTLTTGGGHFGFYTQLRTSTSASSKVLYYL
jgi:hypothetical protein